MVSNDSSSCLEGIALADQVDRRLIVVIDNYIRLAAGAEVCRTGGTAIRGDIHDILKTVTSVLTLLTVQVRQRILIEGRRAGLEGAVLDCSDMADVQRSVSAGSRLDITVVDRVNCRGTALIML